MVAEHKTTSASWQYPFAIRLGNAILSYARYIGKAFWPDHLALMYLHPGYSLRWWQVWASLLFLVVASVLIAAGRRHRYLVVGWLWFLGMMLPTIGLVQVDASAMAGRYAYLPLVGLFLIVCWGVVEWAEQPHLPRFALPAASIAALLVLSAMTYPQVGYWSDPITLWTHTLEITHSNWIADRHLGGGYRARGQPEQALAHFYRAAENGRQDPYVILNIALIEHQRGNQRLAIPYYEKYLAISPDDPANVQVLFNLGHAYDELGDHSRAAEYYLAANHPRPPPHPDIDWQGAWWRELGPYVRERLREWRSGDTSSPK
jgi:tetratricopeptide (TPR) repeat protein